MSACLFQQCPTTSFRIGPIRWYSRSQPGSPLILSAATGHLALVGYCLALLTEHMSLCFIYRFQIACLVIEDDSEALQKLEVLGTLSQCSMWLCCHVDEAWVTTPGFLC